MPALFAALGTKLPFAENEQMPPRAFGNVLWRIHIGCGIVRETLHAPVRMRAQSFTLQC